MTEKTATKPEIASQKRGIKLPPAIGDWTTYRPPKILIKKIKTGLYGFDRLSKEEMNRAMLIHYLFAQDLLKRLKTDLRMGVEFFSCQVEQTTYLNFIKSQNSPVVQGKLSMTDTHEELQLLFDLDMAHSIINHALGSRDIEPINRGLTETEKTIFTATITEYFGHFSSAFDNIFSPPEYSITNAPEVVFDQSINSSASFVTFSAEISLNDNLSQKITFGYLASTLKSLLKKFEEKHSAKPLNFQRLSLAILNKISIPVKALLGNTILLTSEINSLEKGDVVSLDLPINAAVEVDLGSLIKVPAQPGMSNKKISVRIAGFEEELNITPPTLGEEEYEAKTLKERLPKTFPPSRESTIAPEEAVEEEFMAEEEVPEEEMTEEEFPEEEELPEEAGEEFPEGEFPEEEFPEEKPL